MTQKLRIVHCFRSPVGGIFRHVRDLTDAQVAAGHSVGVVCDSSTGGQYEEELFAQMKGQFALGVWRTPMQRHVGPGDIAAAWRTYRIIKELRPDILHGHGAKGGVYARMFGTWLRASRSRVARLYSPHGGSLHYDERTMTGRFFFSVERMMEMVTDHLLFVSDYERQTFHRKVGVPRIRNSLVYNGLRPAEFETVEARPDAADFLYIGMMRDLKGPDLFLDALSKVQSRTGRQITAVMVGDGEDLPRYRKQAIDLGFGESVIFLPPMPARAAFALGRTVVVPSRAEAMPYIVLETLAAGKSMVATSVGGIPEIFGAGSPALVSPDADELSETMCVALTNPVHFHELMPPKDELRRRFGADVMAASVEDAYRASMQR